MRVSGRDAWMPSSFVIDCGIASCRARAHVRYAGQRQHLAQPAAVVLAIDLDLQHVGHLTSAQLTGRYPLQPWVGS
jgi:hypothetical protein